MARTQPISLFQVHHLNKKNRIINDDPAVQLYRRSASSLETSDILDNYETTTISSLCKIDNLRDIVDGQTAAVAPGRSEIIGGAGSSLGRLCEPQ